MCDLKRATVHDIHTEHFGMQRVSAHWAPRLLTDENKERRVSTSRHFFENGRLAELHSLTASSQVTRLGDIIMTLRWNNKSGVWKSSDSLPHRKAKRARSIGKEMDRRGMLLIHVVPKGQTVNSEYYSKVSFLKIFLLVTINITTVL